MKNNEDLLDFSPVPIWVYDIRDLRILSANKAACKNYGYTAEQFLSLTLEVLWADDNKSDMYRLIENKVCKGLVTETLVRHKTVDGNILDVEITSQPLAHRDENARVMAALDITDKLRAKQAAKLVDEFDLLERKVLAINSKKESSTREVLTIYLGGIESLFPQLACSVMRLKTNRIYNWSSPSVPDFLLNEIEGLQISAHAGSCGTAAFIKKKVIVTDIRDDKRWEAFKEITLQAGFLACWSYPLISSDNNVLATFAIYSRRTGEPDEMERMVIERATGLLVIILENRLFAEMLAETHKLMEQGQELARFGIWSWDINDNLVTWSDTLYAIYGINKNNFKATFEGYLELLHPDDRERVMGIISDVQQSRKDVEFEERIIRPDGEIRFLCSWATLNCDEDGQPVKMIGACLDISEWKRTETQLQKSNDRYEYISKASKDAVYDMDFASDHINWGDGLFRVFGYPVNQGRFCLADWERWVHPDDLIALNAELHRALKDPENVSWTAQYRFRHAKGNYLQVEETGYILRDSQGVATQMIGVVRDITERQESAKALIASEKRYSDLFHLSPLPMWVYDLKTYRFLDVNEAAINVYGYTKEEFQVMTIMDVRPVEDILDLDTNLKDMLKPGIFYASIARHLKKNGEMMLVNANGNSIIYNGREARLVVAIDNTEKIRAREALLESERRFKQLIQEGSDLIAIFREDGRFKYLNPAAERVLGIKADEFSVQDAFGFILSDDRDQVSQGVEQLQYGRRVELKPFRIVNHQMEVRWVETILTDLRDDEAVGGVIANARDVTHRISSEFENKEMLERYNVVAKATSDTIWDCNLQTEQINWNHGIKNVFGYDHSSTTYTWWRDHVHPDDFQKINDIVVANMKSGEARWKSQYRFRCEDGSYKFVFDRGFLLFDDDGNAVRMIGAMQDITEQMNYIQKIEEHNGRLKDIAWTQTHLVRGPLARIMGISSLLKLEDRDPDARNQLLDYLEISANELDEVIKTIIEKSQHA
jgi:PAS domain S-box-containing protein